MSAISFASRLDARPIQERREDVPARSYAGGDLAVTLAPVWNSLGWAQRLAQVLPGCTSKVEPAGHRRGDLVLIETPEGEKVELAQQYARPTDSLIRHPTATQMRVIDALVKVGLVLARW